MDERVKIVDCTFNEKGGRHYGFKTILKLKLGDSVLVDTVNGHTYATVVKLDSKPIEGINYKWILAKIDRENLAKKHFAKLSELGIEL